MGSSNITRRDFVKNSVCTFAVASLAGPRAFGQTATATRLEWQSFKLSANYAFFVDAVRKMRANGNASSRSSWTYWVNGHVNYCPHGIAYFLAWHRGYLYYFERQLRTVSGNSSLTLPYWDYYKDPVIPAEFTDPASPLYVDRINTNVYDALDLTPFSPMITAFQRGQDYAFEAQVEYQPHGPVHNIIGAYMASLQSPTDPIFWLHHAQIDRLWAAWVAADDGRTMPARTSSYWKGSFTYGPNLTLARNRVIDTTTYLGYRYQDESMPTSLPPQAGAARIIRVQAQGGQGRGAPGRPPVRRVPPVAGGPAGAGAHSIGGAREVALDENSVSIQIPVQPGDNQSMQAMAATAQASPFAPERAAALPYKSAQLVLDNVRIGPAGGLGGYFYEVYIDLPEGGDPAGKQKYLVGTIGPFEISAAQHHQGSASLVFPVAQVLKNIGPRDFGDVTVSFVRQSGRATPKGEAVVIGELRIELSPVSSENTEE